MDIVDNVTPRLKSTIIESDAVIARTDIREEVVKDAMVFAPLFVQSMKIGFSIDVFVNQDSILSTTTVPSVPQDNSMIFIKEFAESSVEPIKSTTSTQDNATVLQDTTLFKVFAQNVSMMKLIMNTLKNVKLFLARELMNTTQPPPEHASANLNTSELEESALLATLDNTMIVSVIDVSASQDINLLMVFARLFVLLDQLTLMDNVSVQMDFLSIMENAEYLIDALLMLTGIRELSAASATLDSESSTESAVAINTVVLMDILNTDNATVKMDISGFFMHAENVVLMKLTMELLANAILDIIETLTDTVSRLTFNLLAMKMKDGMMQSRLVSAFLVLNT